MYDLEKAKKFFDGRHGKVQHVWQGVLKREPHQLLTSEKSRPWLFRCPAPLCFYNVSAATEKDINRQAETHPCPWFGGGTTTLGWSVMSEQFLRDIWGQLDLRVNDIMGEEPPDDPGFKERARYEARGLAVALAVLMPPFFYKPDEIAREAKKRWDERAIGNDSYETPGMGRLRLKPPPTEYTTAGLRKTDTSVQTTLDDQTKAGIKAALESGLFTDKQLASTYSVTEEYIRSLA